MSSERLQGWYPDPGGRRMLCWWDGQRWTGDTRPPVGEANALFGWPQPSFTPAPQRPVFPAAQQPDPRWQQYGQQQHYQQPYSQPPPQGAPPRHRRHLVRNALAGIGGLVVIMIATAAIASAGSGSHTVTASQGASSASATAAAPAKVGSAITLTGNNSGEKMAVTVVKVLSDAQPASEFDAASSGDRLYAVQFRLTDTGNAAYSDAPSNGAVVTDASGQSYQSSLDNAAECDSFPGTENIAVGASGLGCVVFEVPASTVITGVQFTLDSGMGPQTGQWDVRS